MSFIQYYRKIRPLTQNYEGRWRGLSLVPGGSRRDAMNHDDVLAVLSDSKEEAKSIKEIAQAMGLEISSYVDW